MYVLRLHTHTHSRTRTHRQRLSGALGILFARHLWPCNARREGCRRKDTSSSNNDIAPDADVDVDVDVNINRRLLLLFIQKF